VVTSFQDFIAEALALPCSGEGTRLPTPNVKVTRDGFRLWYGDSGAPHLELTPLGLMNWSEDG
jgi:hypothetical protein